MSIPEEAGKTISNVADALKTNPSCLAAITLAAIFGILTYLTLRDEQAQTQQRQMLLLEKCFPTPRDDSFAGRKT